MITVEIKKSKRLKEYNSAFVSFPYNAEIVNYFRRMPVKFYLPETKQWEIPTTLVPNFVMTFGSDNVKIIDNSTDTQLEARASDIDDTILNGYDFKTKPFEHQLFAIKYGLKYDAWFLGDEMGLGKTKTAIDIAVARKLRYGYKHCLIVCGVNTLKWNWVNEVLIHSNEKPWILGQKETRNGIKIGSTKDKLADLQYLLDNETTTYFIITNIESFRDKEIADTVKKLCDKKIINMCVFDEAHKCKNPQSQQTKGFIKCQPEVRLAMTGTPLMNSPLDLFIILKWLGFENHSFTAFKNHYCVLGGYGGYEVISYKNLDELNNNLNAIMVRRLKSEVFDLPEKTYIEDYVEMLPKQEVLYKEVKANIVSNLDMINFKGDPLASLIRLRQVTGCPGILSSDVTESAKLDRMEDLVEEAISNGHKVLIFSNWTQMTSAIVERLDRHKRWNGLVITGDTQDNVRQKYVQIFQTDDNQNYMVGTIGAMGTGLTLTAATVVIFVDEPWNKALFEQAVDRCHRIGTTNNITIYSIMCKGTIDERVHSLIYKKGVMSDAIVDNKLSSKEILNYLLD